MELGKCLLTKETFNAEIVINAGGLWAREVGQLAGIKSSSTTNGASLFNH